MKLSFFFNHSKTSADCLLKYSYNIDGTDDNAVQNYAFTTSIKAIT